MKQSRIISFLLAFALCLSMLPALTFSARADGDARVENITITSGTSLGNNQPLFVKSDGDQFEKFSFNSNTREYDIALVDAGNQADMTARFSATISNDAIGAKDGLSLGARFSNASQNADEKGISGTALKIEADKPYNMLGSFLALAANTKMANTDPYQLRFVTGYYQDSGVAPTTAAFSDTDIYTFNFYRKATLKSFAVAYKNGPGITKGIPSTFDPYVVAYEITDVEPGEVLTITAPAYTQANTILKVAGSDGVFTAG